MPLSKRSRGLADSKDARRCFDLGHDRRALMKKKFEDSLADEHEKRAKGNAKWSSKPQNIELLTNNLMLA